MVARWTGQDVRVAAWRERLRRTIAGLSGREVDPTDDDAVAVDPHPSAVAEAAPPGLDKNDVTALSFEAIQSVLARYRMAGLPADLAIDVPVDACKTVDFHRADEMIGIGRRLAADALDQFEQNFLMRCVRLRPRRGTAPSGILLQDDESRLPALALLRQGLKNILEPAAYG